MEPWDARKGIFDFFVPGVLGRKSEKIQQFHWNFAGFPGRGGNFGKLFRKMQGSITRLAPSDSRFQWFNTFWGSRSLMEPWDARTGFFEFCVPGVLGRKS